MKMFKWASPLLIPLFFLAPACEKDLSTGAIEERQTVASTVSARSNGNGAFALPGTPTFVNTTWTRSGMASCRYCNLRLTTSTVPGATSYQWQLWLFGEVWLSKTTTVPVWTVGQWNEGQTCFFVKVRAVSAGGAGAWYTSPQKCPPNNPPCCVP